MSTTRPRRRKLALILLGLALAAVAVGAALMLRPQIENSAAGPSAPVTAGPVNADAAAGTSPAPYTIKAEPSAVATDEPTRTDGGWIDVVLTYAAFDADSGTVQASGFAAGVIEDGGTCTLTLSRGSEEIEVTTTAQADANATSCGLLESPAGLAAGTWDAVLAYSSADARGESGRVEVTVP